MLEDGLFTNTAMEQAALEAKVAAIYADYAGCKLSDVQEGLVLQRARHVSYLHSGLHTLPSGYVSLDASRPWICYWILHSLALLEAPLPGSLPAESVVEFLATCAHPAGGYGGGPGQLAHLAPTYAALASLLTLGGQAALASIDRPAVQRFLQRMAAGASRGGGFTVCEGGEVDVRGCYTAMAAAHMLGLDAPALAQEAGMVRFVRACQTYEGGLGGEPWNEAHGGYTFCGLAALALVGQVGALDLRRLAHWAVHRQGTLEGGFMGRTNKLVDGCYSFWQGGLFPLLQRLMPEYQAQCGVPREPPAAPARPIEVPDLPDLVLAGPQQQADQAGRAAEVAEAAATAALEQGQEPSSPDSALTQARASLAAAARSKQQTARRAAAHRDAVQCSAALLCCGPVRPDPGRRPARRVEELPAEPAAADRQPGAVPVATAVDPDAPASREQPPAAGHDQLLCNARALQLWVLQCCQAERGGLRDKPGKPPDYYHTCYCLSGLSAIQHHSGTVVGPCGNLLAKAELLCNVRQPKLDAALAWMQQQQPAMPCAPAVGCYV